MPTRTGGWFTSSYSNNGGTCVEVCFTVPGVEVADSKDRGAGPVIAVSGAEWDDLVLAALASASLFTVGAGVGAPDSRARRPRLAGGVDRGSRTGDRWAIAPPPAGGHTITVDGTPPTCTARDWTAFLAGAGDGEFARPTAPVVTPGP